MATAQDKLCKERFPDDAALIEGVRGGKDRAVHCLYRMLFKKSFPSLRKLVYDHKGNEEDAEDLFQEAFLTFRRKILDGSYTYKSDTALSTYFFEVFRRKWMDEMRRITRTRMVDYRLAYEESKETETVELTLIRTEREEYLRAQIAKLGEQCAFILKKFIWDKWSLDSIADSLKLTPASAKNQKYRCMQKLRKLYTT